MRRGPTVSRNTSQPMSAAKTVEVSRSWVIYHVLEHDLFHGGEISLILGMNGLQGIDL